MNMPMNYLCSDIDNKSDEYQNQNHDVPRNEPATHSIWFSKRMCVSILLFLGYFLHGIICQGNAIVLVAMTTDDSKNWSGNQTSIIQPKEFDWDSRSKNLILTTFQIGFLFSLLGGFLAQKYGGAKVFGISMGLTGAILLLMPTAVRARFHFYLLSQALVGILQGFCLVSATEIFACWIPFCERMLIMVLVTCGMHFGTAIMVDYYYFYNCLLHSIPWSAYIYVSGFGCIIWSIIWLTFVKNEPLEDERISTKELRYILQQNNSSPIMTKRGIATCWDILKSTPCWALFAAKFALGFASASTIAYLPFNLAADLTRELVIIGTKESLRNIEVIPGVITVNGLWVMSAGLGMIIGDLKMAECPQSFDKIFASIFMTFAASFFFAFTRFPNGYIGTIVLYGIVQSALSFTHIISEGHTTLIAPNHTSLVSGLGLFCQTVGSIFTQIVLSITVENHNLDDWNFYIYSSAATLVICAVAFLIWGSHEPLEWSIVENCDIDKNHLARCAELISLSNTS